jgi:Leucine-rich repeat (LRR) protein
MRDLIWLNLFDNRIEEVDEKILSTLNHFFRPSNFAKSLRLSYNRIKVFPKIITQMSYLQELHLAGNEIEGNRGVLLIFGVNLKINSPHFIEIPDTIDNMKELIVLSLANNKVPLKLPRSFTFIPKLRKLYLRGSDVEFTSDIEELRSLIEIDLSPKFVRALDENVRESIPLQISLVRNCS